MQTPEAAPASFDYMNDVYCVYYFICQ